MNAATLCSGIGAPECAMDSIGVVRGLLEVAQ